MNSSVDAADDHDHLALTADIVAAYVSHNTVAVSELTGLITQVHAALLHVTLEDTDTTPEELKREVGAHIRDIVREVTDDKTLPKAERKRQQVLHAAHASREAKLVKLADKICNLRDMGYAVNVDDKLVDEVSEYFTKAAKAAGKPVGVPNEYDAAAFDHQVPGGMISNFRAQLSQAGLSHKLPEVLDECARVRAELGWPIMITPFSQFVGTLAVLNVVNGERYKIIPDEVKMYALGYNGKLLAPIDPDRSEEHTSELQSH